MLIISGRLRNIYAVSLVFLFCAAGLLIAQYRIHAQTDEEKRSTLQKSLDQMEQEAQQLDTFIGQTHQETQSLASAKKTLDAEVKRREIEISRLALSLKETTFEITYKKSGIAELSKKIDKSRRGLSASILLLYNYDEENPLTILLKHTNISSFFQSVDALGKVQTNIQASLKNFRGDRVELESRTGS